MKCVPELVRNNLEVVRNKMSPRYDKKNKIRDFREEELVLLLDGTKLNIDDHL